MSERIRQELIEYGNKLVEHNLTKGTGGNLSFFDRATGEVYITPSGIEFGRITPEDIVVLDLEGKVLQGTRKPSSEWAMHLIMYQKRDDIDAVVHAHTTYTTVIALLNEDLPASHYMLAVAGPNVRCAEYATFGTPELAENAFQAMRDRKAVILANHGILAGEKTLKRAFNVVEEVEYCAQLHILARSIGQPVIISPEEMDSMAVRFRNYGQPKE